MSLCERVLLAMVLLAIVATGVGCASVRGGAAAIPASQPTDQICLTRGEYARVQAFKVRCRSKVKELRGKLKHKLATKDNQGKSKLEACKTRLKGCYEQAKTKQKCPSCLKPAAIVGTVCGTLGLAVGIVVGVIATLAVKGDLRQKSAVNQHGLSTKSTNSSLFVNR